MANMISRPIQKIRGFFTEGHSRTLKAKKNILIALFMKGGSVLISFVLVPLTINYINPVQYGIWLTLSSIILWFSFFDVGLGNGLRNKLAESLAQEDFEKAKIYVSTTYAAVAMIICPFIIIFVIVNQWLDWTVILNTDKNMAQELSTLALVVFSFFGLQFVLQLINTVVTGNQQPSRVTMFTFFHNLLALTIIYLLTQFTDGNLIYLGFAIGSAPVVVLAIASIWMYRSEYKDFRPSIKFIRFESIKDLMGLGIKFFILQVNYMVVFQSGNIIITQLFGPEQVVPYNLAYKYFNLIPMGLGIIMIPFWSAFTEAWVKGDIDWVKSTFKKLQYIWVGLILLSFLMFLFASTFYYFWVGEEISVPWQLSFVMMFYVILYAWNNIHTAFLNGVGKVNMQLIFSLAAAILNIPLAIYLGKQLGIHGVILAPILLGLVNLIWMPIQVSRVMNKTATGIWNK